jgi:diadenosine tetraphosphate (Ap4A) HIT family hydrolase
MTSVPKDRWTHEPAGYDCPFCRMQLGVHNEHNQAEDVVAVNEPAGNQDVWHLHVHVFPRHDGDRSYGRHEETRWVGAEERAPYADLLSAHLRLPRTFA